RGGYGRPQGANTTACVLRRAPSTRVEETLESVIAEAVTPESSDVAAASGLQHHVYTLHSTHCTTYPSLAANLCSPDTEIQPQSFCLDHGATKNCICDLQEKFRPAIHEFPRVVATAQKLLKASQILNIPVFATTQNRARLGETCPELKLDAPGGIKTVCHLDKTLFSMITPEVQKSLDSLDANGPLSCIMVGIESHICITQTTVDLLNAGHKVYIIADGVSSCNKEEVPIALARLRHAGAIVTTSESFIYELVGDAGTTEFKEIIKLIKETSSSTRETMQTLCKI
ncbi:hypothetical protein J1614_008335, partial [Plenodomus biglobosus]